MQAALRWNQLLLERAPNNARFMRDQSELRALSGLILVETGRSEEGLEELHQAVILAEKQVAQDPSNFVPQISLVSVLQRQSNGYASLARKPEATAAQRTDYWQRAIEGLARCEEKLNLPNVEKATRTRGLRTDIARDLTEARAALGALAEKAEHRTSAP